MNRLLQSSLGGLALLATALQASAEGISTQPEGTLYDNVYRSSYQYIDLFGSTHVMSIEGQISKMVINGNDIYLCQPILNFSISQPYWIKGEIDNGNVTFPVPQPLYVEPANPYVEGSTETQVYMKVFDAKPGEDGAMVFTGLPDTHVPMTWHDGVLEISPIDDSYNRVLGLADADGNFLGSAEEPLSWSIFNDTPAKPAGEIATKDYLCTAESSWGATIKHVVKIGEADGEMWIQGLYQYFDDAWIHGKTHDGKATFTSNQYLGIYTTENYYYFFQAATAEPYISEWGAKAFDFTPAPDVTLTPEGSGYIADKGMLMTFGKNTANPGMPLGSALVNVKFTPFEARPAIPADPSIVSMGDYYEQWGRTVTFNVPMEDVDGNFINPDNLYYNIFINGEKYTLTPEVYPTLTEPITDIPYRYEETGVVFTNGEAEHSVTLFIAEDIDFGVQSVYTVDGVENKSSLVTTAGVADGVIADRCVTVEWYDLTGRKVSNPSKGLYIKVETRADGSRLATKTLR